MPFTWGSWENMEEDIHDLCPLLEISLLADSFCWPLWRCHILNTSVFCGSHFKQAQPLNFDVGAFWQFPWLELSLWTVSGSSICWRSTSNFSSWEGCQHPDSQDFRIYLYLLELLILVLHSLATSNTKQVQRQPLGGIKMYVLLLDENLGLLSAISTGYPLTCTSLLELVFEISVNHLQPRSMPFVCLPFSRAWVASSVASSSTFYLSPD